MVVHIRTNLRTDFKVNLGMYIKTLLLPDTDCSPWDQGPGTIWEENMLYTKNLQIVFRKTMLGPINKYL